MEECIILNGEICYLGKSDVITIGINTLGKKIITKSKVFVVENTVMIYNGDIFIAVSNDAINDLYLDTPTNRTKLKRIINNG